jgi:hypothetical protein
MTSDYEDWQKAVLMLGLMAEGLPDWVDGKVDTMLSILTGWPIERATKAFDDAAQRGMIKKTTLYRKKSGRKTDD